MPRPTLAQLRGVGDFQALWRWDIDFLGAARLGTFSNDLNLRAETTEIPKKTGQTIEVNIRGHKTRMPGIYAPVGTMTFSFVEGVTNVVSSFIAAWKEQCWATNNGTSLTKDQLQMDILMRRLNNQDVATYEYKLKGCFYEDADFGTLDGSTSDIWKPSLTISYDDFEEKQL